MHDLLFYTGSQYYLTQSAWELRYEFSASTSETLTVTFLATGEGDNIARIRIENFEESPILGIHFACGTGQLLIPDEFDFLGELTKVLGALEKAKAEAKNETLWNEAGWFRPQS